MRDNIACLTTIPASDGNFICSLEYATVEELEKALEILKDGLQKGAKNKSRIMSCERELRKRNKVNK